MINYKNKKTKQKTKNKKQKTKKQKTKQNKTKKKKKKKKNEKMVEWFIFFYSLHLYIYLQWPVESNVKILVGILLSKTG